ncbi:hypothetical protein DXG01_011066 [Tephrocybe rancida]|nr:hypothetical protein DXG01_011066 [Tephrocybe rancida]
MAEHKLTSLPNLEAIFTIAFMTKLNSPIARFNFHPDPDEAIQYASYALLSDPPAGFGLLTIATDTQRLAHACASRRIPVEFESPGSAVEEEQVAHHLCM